MTYSGTTKTIETGLSVNRRSDGFIYLTISDKSSRNYRMIEVKLTPEAFALAVTGMSEIECSSELKNIEFAGKTKIVEKRTMDYSGQYIHDRKYLEQFIKENTPDDGWFIDPSLGSQSSITNNRDRSVTLNYSAYRYE